MSDNRILSQAVLAATIIGPRVLNRVLEASSADDCQVALRELRAAQAHALELLTRLEVAETELCAIGAALEQQARSVA